MKKNPFKNKVPKRFEKIKKMDKDKARDKIEDLREAIEYHNYLYYVRNKPKISDRTFDRLFRRLVDMEESFPDLKSPDSPTRRVGTKPVSKLKKVDHSKTMLSLNSALEEQELKDFTEFVEREIEVRDIEYITEPKFDGLSVEIVYEKGHFKYGATRGDGQTGEDISENLKTIGSVPLRLRRDINLPDFLAVRGEVLMHREGFQQLNKKRIESGEEPFANPRNAAAGLVRQLDSKKVSGKPLDIFFYDLLDSSANGFETHWEILDKFPEWGLKTNSQNKKCANFEEIVAYREKLRDEREKMDFDIDGIVIKLNDLNEREKLGVRERSPRWAMAWKFPPKKEVTVLHDIVVQVGRTGMLTPVALLEPVEVGGVTVSRATLHNEDEVKRKDVRPGDPVKIVRAGDVIPEVDSRVKEGGKKRKAPFSMPESCPVCESDVVKEGAYYFCQGGLACKAQLKGHILHYASRKAMNIDHLGEQVVEQMVDKDMVSEIAGLYEIKLSEIKELDGFAEKSAKNLHEAIQNAKEAALDRFLYALGIRHVGAHVARLLSDHFKDLQTIREADYEDFLEIDEIGPEIAQSISKFFDEKKNRKALDRLLDQGIKLKKTAGKKGDKLKGKVFVFTGDLENYTRSEAENRVETLGGRATSSVSSNTDYVVVGKDPGQKADDAREKNIKILDERKFESLINES